MNDEGLPAVVGEVKRAEARAPLERLYSVEEVAGLWGFSRWWVRTRARAGVFGDLVDFDGDLRIRESGLRAYQESKARTPWVVPEERRKRGIRIKRAGKDIGAAA